MSFPENTTVQALPLDPSVSGHLKRMDQVLDSMFKGTIGSLPAKEFELAEDVVKWIADYPEEAFESAVQRLLRFLQCNWTGPPPPAHTPADVNILAFLGDSEPAYRLCYLPVDLAVSLVLLEKLADSSKNFKVQFELLKVYWMQQQLMDEPSADLHKKALKIIVELESCRTAEHIPDSVAVELLLLCSHVCGFYYDHGKQERLLKEAQNHCRIAPVVTGILGKRTRFQETEYAQLVVDLKDTKNLREPAPYLLEKAFPGHPTNVTLDDDTLLDKLELSSAPQHHQLSDYEAAVVLAEGVFLHRRQAKLELDDQNLAAFMETVLVSNPPFAVQACALFHRSKIELNKSRKMLRAMQQLETLTDAFRNVFPPAEVRQNFAPAVNLLPFWKVEEALGFALLQNGLTKEAINSFTRLELWEDVIECYQRIGQKVKAEDLILKEIAKNATASMWCRLGDIREAVECYEKAWTLSKGRSARSRRDLGRLYIRRQLYEDAARVLREGLEVNSIDASAWFSLGYSLVKIKEFGEAESAFRRCVNLDPENSLAWNNLGSIALRNQDYPKAYRILQDSIKADYENWNVWDNYQNACQRVKDFEEEISACHRLLQIRGQLNVESLGLLVAAVIDGVPDIHGNSAVRLVPKLKELFGAMTAKLADNAQVWYMYGKLQASELDHGSEQTEEEIMESVIQKYQRAYRYAIKDKDWEKDEHSLLNALAIAKDLASLQLKLLRSDASDVVKKDTRASCRVMLDNLVLRIEKSLKNVMTGELNLLPGCMSQYNGLLQMRTEIKL